MFNLRLIDFLGSFDILYQGRQPPARGPDLAREAKLLGLRLYLETYLSSNLHGYIIAETSTLTDLSEFP